MRETARERGRWKERVRKRKREFIAVYPYRISLAALASPRQRWAESKTANSQQVQPTHGPLEAIQMLLEHKKCNASGKTGVTADRDKIEFGLFNSSLIFNITLREELY